MYHDLAERVGGGAWQSTHLGGHHFAPTLVAFPEGTFYGRLTSADLESFVQTQGRGELYLDNLRGRCCYNTVTQAAEHFLRQETGVCERSAYRLLGERRLDEKHWAVTFTSSGVGEIHRLTLAREISSDECLVSCSPMKAKPVAEFRLVHHEVS